MSELRDGSVHVSTNKGDARAATIALLYRIIGIMNLDRALRSGSLYVLPVAMMFSPIAGWGQLGEASSYAKEIDTWHEERVERLIRPDGYLATVALFWLEEGRFTFGADPSSDLVFTGKVPPHIGTFTVEGNEVQVDITPGTSVLHDGRPVRSVEMLNDHQEGGPTVLEMGTLSWYVIRRGGRLAIRVKDSDSKALKSFHGVERFPVSTRWRIEGKLERYEVPKPITVDRVGGFVTTETSPGRVVFELDGVDYRIDIFGAGDSEELWAIFGDATNGESTYDGGRFLTMAAPDEHGRVILDFNKAYNPPCAFSDFTTCPLPPPGSRLGLAVTAGEKAYRDKGS